MASIRPSSETKPSESAPIDALISSASRLPAISSARLAKSMPKKHGQATGGLEILMCTSAAPASRSIVTIARCVLPRTIESSTTTTRWPAITSRSGLSFSLMPRCLIVWLGWMNVRPT